MFYLDLKQYIQSDKIDEILKKISCSDDIKKEKERYLSVLDNAYKLYGDGDYHFISSPGRSEIGGNHTDHQHGHILAASLNIDNLVVVKKNNTNIINYKYDDIVLKPIDISDLEIIEEEKNSSYALIRGIASRIKQLSYEAGGFDAYCDSKVLVGSGISSSACFEVMICEVFNCLFNEGKINPVDRALISQYAENVYFGKPSGLMDQMSISVGDFVAIDFKDPNNPIIEKYDFSFNDFGYELMLIDTKGDHSDLSEEYSNIPNEMKLAANALNKEFLADCSLDEFIKNISDIRKQVNNDRSLLRAIHFFLEDERVIKQKQAIASKDIEALLKLMRESGRSSYEYLQNVSVYSRPKSQAIALALASCETVLKEKGAFRVHGGGFEGTIQVIVPNDKKEELKKLMISLFGDDCLLEVSVRPAGTITVI